MFILTFLTFLLVRQSEGYMEEYLQNRNHSTDNWTSCEEFLNNTSFDLTSLIDVDWMIFYFWSPHPEKSYHIRYSTPSAVLIDRFRSELDKVLQPRVNWSHADLFVETSIDFSGLFIRTDLPGKFRLIPSFSFQYHYSPYLEFAVKVVDGFLGMMNCKQKVAYALAPVEKLPNPLEIDKVAGIFGIRNPLGRSYLTKKEYDLPEALQGADDDEEVHEDWHGTPVTADIIF